MSWDSDRSEAAAGYEPTEAARLNYLEYLLSEPQMDQALEAVAALQEGQRRVLVDFLRQVAPGENLAIDLRREALVKGRDA